MAADQPPRRDGGAGQADHAERGAHPPLHQGLGDERVRRRARPLNHVRDVDTTGADVGEVRLVGQPLLVDAQAPDAVAGKRVGLGHPKRDEGADEGDRERRQTVEHLAARGAPAARPHERQAKNGQQGERADLARGGQSGHDAGQQRIPQALALPGAMTEEQTRGGERRHEGVDREVVRQLDVEHGEREQQRAEVRHAHAEDASRQQPGEHDRGQVGDGRQRPTDQVDRGVARVARPFGNLACQRQRQLAIGVVVVAARVGVEARARGVEVLANRGRHVDAVGDDRHQPLVGMLVRAGVPGHQAVDAKTRGDQQDQREHHKGQARGSTGGHGAW